MTDYQDCEKRFSEYKRLKDEWKENGMDVMFSSKSNEWETPQRLFDELDSEFMFTLDPCSTIENHKCEKYYTIKDNGLEKSWEGETVFVNPPYGKEIGKWVKKCFSENALNGTTCVMLIPSRTDTQWFHKYIYNKSEIRFLEGRIKFSNSINSAPFPSMVVIYRGNT